MQVKETHTSEAASLIFSTPKSTDKVKFLLWQIRRGFDCFDSLTDIHCSGEFIKFTGATSSSTCYTISVAHDDTTS